jgi:ATP-dependent Clp protease adaptor protein ClpS
MHGVATSQVHTPREPKCVPERRERPKQQPFYDVVLLDDDDHTYEYVIGMLRRLFGFGAERAYTLAREVDTRGRVVVDTTTFERAELKRDQIHSFGRDWRLARCQGSMTALIEPVPGS